MVSLNRKATLVALVAVVAALPLTGHAATTTYTAPYEAGPQGGDPFPTNHYDVRPQTGQVTVLRTQVLGVSGNLGCGGRGPFAYFKVAHAGPGVTAVTATYTEAVIDPYTFIDVAVRQGGDFLGSKSVRGPIVGDGSVTVELVETSTAATEVWFGIQVTSACPNVDGGTARFTSLTVTST